jgi:bacterioferritin-associated ferredoxin
MKDVAEERMIVCQCAGVSDRTIVRLVQAGATTLDQVARRTGAATCCGSCREFVEIIILRTLEASSVPSPESRLSHEAVSASAP